MNGVTPSQYTSLETLLFFQALRAQSLTSIDFKAISTGLQSIPLVSNDATFDVHRLSPDALQKLYLNLVKEEAKRDLELADQDTRDGQDGGISPGSRKRKAPSPTIPTVEEAAKHSHLLPGLLFRLYSGFREQAVADIRREEQRYDSLSREIDEIEKGEQDEKLHQQQTKQHATHANQPLPGQSAPETDSNHARGDDRRPSAAPEMSRTGQQTQDARPTSARASIDALVNHGPENDVTYTSPHPRKPSATVTSLPPLSEMAPEHLANQHSPNLNRLPSQLPLPLQQGAYHGSPPLPHQSPYGSHYHANVASGPSPSPKLQSAISTQSPSSPRRMLPLPPGMKQSPVMQHGMPSYRGPPPMQPAQYPSPNQRLPSMPAPPNDRQSARPPPPSTHVPGPPSYQHQPYPPYQSPQQQYAAQQQQTPYPVRPSQQGGFQLPPFQVAAQDPSKAHHQQIAQQGTPQHSRSPVPPTPRTAGTGYGHYSPYPQPVQNRVQPSPQPNNFANSVLASLKRSRRGTWKSTEPPPIVRPSSPSQPVAEPLSPVKRRATLAVKPTDQEKVSDERRERRATEGPQHTAQQVGHAIEPPPRPATVTKKQSRKVRGNSVASSAVASSVRERTRSQSVASQVGEASSTAEKPAGRKVKKEPLTPADTTLQDEEPTAEATPAQTRPTRQRKSTVQSQASSSAKRGRQESPTVEDGDDAKDGESVSSYVPPSNNVIYATRNFQRMSAVILNEIAAHRHGGQFQRPVREKDAPGYDEIIKRPQDLKSIKAAITAGSRAIAAAALKESTAESPAGTPAKDTGTLALEKTADLMPPKAIVNSSQLEKEVMRMFANAVMFNPGEGNTQDGGIVQDAREMAEDIEAKVRDWRGVERQVDGREDDDETVGSAKRRKL